VFGFLLCGKHAKNGTVKDDFVYVMMNMYWDGLEIEIPGLPQGVKWHISVNTDMPSPQDIHEPGKEPVLENQHNMIIGPRSTVVLVGR
jgi:glycogen operon protein